MAYVSYVRHYHSLCLEAHRKKHELPQPGQMVPREFKLGTYTCKCGSSGRNINTSRWLVTFKNKELYMLGQLNVLTTLKEHMGTKQNVYQNSERWLSRLICTHVHQYKSMFSTRLLVTLYLAYGLHRNYIRH